MWELDRCQGQAFVARSIEPPCGAQESSETLHRARRYLNHKVNRSCESSYDDRIEVPSRPNKALEEVWDEVP